jgi:hypothetical protein
MSLTGPVFLGLVLVITVGAFVALVVLWPRLAGREVWHVAGRAGLLLGVNLLVLLTAATQLNAQFLFFADWSDLGGAFGGTAFDDEALARLKRGRGGGEDGQGDVGRERQRRPGRHGDGPLSGITAPVVVRLHADPLSYGSSAALLKVAKPPMAVEATVLQHAGAPHLSLARIASHRPRLAGREHPGLPPGLVTPYRAFEVDAPDRGVRMCVSAPLC